MIEICDVSKIYGGRQAQVCALRGINLDIRTGEMLMLAGPSGSGKTTLLSILGCILKPTSGSVRIDGREVSQLAERALPPVRLAYFGFIFQGFNLFPALTARENVELALNLKGTYGKKARREAGDLLAAMGLAAKCASVPADLSGGEKQRVAIARALAGKPPILLADEPTAALDSQSGANVMDTLAALCHERRHTVVVVTHDSRVLEYADRIVRLSDGSIVPADQPSHKEQVA